MILIIKFFSKIKLDQQSNCLLNFCFITVVIKKVLLSVGFTVLTICMHKITNNSLQFFLFSSSHQLKTLRPLNCSNNGNVHYCHMMLFSCGKTYRNFETARRVKIRAKSAKTKALFFNEKESKVESQVKRILIHWPRLLLLLPVDIVKHSVG